jgi:hypothetical protein
MSDPAHKATSSASGGSGASATAAGLSTATSPPARTTRLESGNTLPLVTSKIPPKKVFCQNCTSNEHHSQNCKVKMLCEICSKTTHVTGACVADLEIHCVPGHLQ